jgi:predicted DCC family thiol-disulfide oxidoreductase YuxK
MTARHSEPLADQRFEVFYDGACPLCMREIRFLRRLDRKGRIRFTDIAAADFRASDYGTTLEALMSEIHGRLPDGSWVRGVEVFRRLYSAVGLGPLVWVSRLPIVAGILDRGYRLFARNRLRWTGRCSDSEGSCGVKAYNAGTNTAAESGEGSLDAA